MIVTEAICEGVLTDVAVTTAVVAAVVGVGAVYVSLTIRLSPTGYDDTVAMLPGPVSENVAPRCDESFTTDTPMLSVCPASSVWLVLGEIAMADIPPPPHPAVTSRADERAQASGVA